MTLKHTHRPNPAQLTWLNDQPYSTHYDDVYFSSDHGLKESQYVFISGNRLSARWQQADFAKTFTIIETGFGTGLNFCCAAQLWQSMNNHEQQLHYISVEKHPLSKAALHKALTLWPQLTIAETLIAQYQPHAPKSGVLTLKVAANIQLSLIFKDVVEALSSIQNTADAWFLDGFSPAKNPDMWQPTVFAQMARLSKPNTTFATFTSAGFVRRGLIAAGFAVNKQAGFGKKREMLTGAWQPTDENPK